MNYKKRPELLSSEIIERAKRLNSTLLADATKGTGSMDISIKPVTKEMKVVGTATTVSMKPTDNLYLHEAIYSEGAGYVLVADGKGQTSHAYLGELMAYAAKAMEFCGIVIDGAVRDRLELEKIKLPIFSKGFVPNGPYKNGPGKINDIITCGGVAVSPGDLIVGDADGVTVVAKDDILEVLEQAEKKLEYEKDRINKIEDYIKKKNNNEDTESIAPSWLKGKI
ncbi:RraA family protein [Oceanobacillus jeddahense]|uniref:RraA family protein n=1 Tax=Oceanobacillus jeddahense TaxID=1462527 RepID=UPI000595BBFE|nr:RraA family protein [Oceanobacillus jeddahense]